MEQNTNVSSGVSLAEKHHTTEQQLFAFSEYRPEEAERTGCSEYSYWKSVWRNFIKKRLPIVMFCIFLCVFVFSLLSDNIGKYTYSELRSDTKLMLISPNSEYWFGTDNLGRDYWCQVWFAARTSIKLAAIVAVGELLLGVAIGCIWGYVRRAERFITEIYIIFDSIPTLIYMTLIALMIGRSFKIMAISLIAFGWLRMARNVRNLVLMYRDREYNLASRCLGTKLWRILTRNILPYLVSVIILRVALSIPQTVAYETTLSYLGLGLGIDTPSLGILLRNARGFFVNYPYLLVFPAVIVSLITVTFYLVGNAFSDASDPRNHV